MEPQVYLSRLNEILVQKQARLKEMLDLTRLQKEAIADDDMDELELLIAKKQARMDAVDKLDEQFLVYLQGLKRTLGIKSLDELPAWHIPGAAELKENTAAVLDILREIKVVDDENTAAVKSRMAELKGKISQSNSFRKVSAAYLRPGQNLANPYFDQKK